MAVEQRTTPNQSLYIQNIPENIQKQDLRRELYMLFSTYGPVLDVTAVKTSKMRGQAHILFRDIPAATQAMRAYQGFDFFGRQIRIGYAKSRSHTLSRMTGVFENPEQQAEPQQSVNTSHAAPPGLPHVLPGPPLGLPSTLSGPPPGLSSAPPGLSSAPPGLPSAPPGLPSTPHGLPGAPPGLPAPPHINGKGLAAPDLTPANAPSPQGVKRQREESDEEAAEDDSGEGEMDMSDDD